MTYELDLIVPVLGRPHRAAPFVRSLAESNPVGVRLVVVPSPWDSATYNAWRETQATGIWSDMVVLLYPGNPGSFPQKVNHAYTTLAGDAWDRPAPWLMLCGDDVAFDPSWWAVARRHMADDWVSVIGTWTGGPKPDGGTPHPLIRRSYVDTQGASWDGPGVLCHEGYRHNFVDVEIALAAQRRKVWAFPCPPDDEPIRVEHLAYYQGKAGHDETYGISDATVENDRKLFHRRDRRYRQRPMAREKAEAAASE